MPRIGNPGLGAASDVTRGIVTTAPSGTVETRLAYSRSNIPWSAMAYGAVLVLAAQFVLAIMGAGLGLGLATMPDPNGTEIAIGYTAGAFVLVCMGLTAVAGGFVSAWSARAGTRADAALAASGTWALSTLAVIFFATTGGATLLGGIFLQAGVRSESAAVARTIIGELQSANFRIISDLELLEGKAVTRMAIDRTAPPTTDAEKQVTEQVTKNGADAPPAAREAREKIALASGATGLFAFAAFGLAALAAWIGGLLAVRRRGRYAAD